MTDQGAADLLQKATQWWSTDIIDMKPGVIRFRGFPIEQLIGRVSFPQMIWLMLKGDLPSSEQGALLEAALVSAVDHGPQAPSIAIGRMAVTCGLPLNGAMASAINVLDDIHGGAGEQCMELYADIARRQDAGVELKTAIQQGLDDLPRQMARSFPASDTAFTPSIRARRGCSSSSTRRATTAWCPDASPRSAVASRTRCSGAKAARFP